jgi:starvation-inducible outer membrane lipoprotein
MKKVIFCTLLLLAGCAKMPDDIAPATVSADPYAQMTCENLAVERQSKQIELKRYVDQQTETANRDKAWMTIVHVPIGSMTNGDVEPQVANLKGQLNAINQASQAKACPAA